MTAETVSPPPPGDYYAPAEGGLDVKDLLAILRRRRKVIVSTILLVTALAILAGLQITPRYTATSLVMIDPRNSNVVDVEAVMQGLGTDASTVESQIRIIGSRFQLERLAEQLRIFDDPEFNLALNAPDRQVDVRVNGPLQAAFSWVPDEWLVATGLADEQMAQLEDQVPELLRETVIERFAEDLEVTPEGRSYVIKIGFTSVDPQKAATIANAAAESYVEALLEEKLGASADASEWLSSRLNDLRQDLEESDVAVERFRAENGLSQAQGVSIKEQRLFDLNQMLSQLRADHAAQTAKVGLIRAMRGRGTDAITAVPEVLGSPTIINLRERESDLLKQENDLRSTFGPRHPLLLSLQGEKKTLNGKVLAEVDRIIQTIENDSEVMVSRIAALEEEIRKVEAGNSEEREVNVKLRELEREAGANRMLYEAFLMRYKETEEQAGILEADAKVISTAAPPAEPSTPGPVLFGAVGFTASVMLGSLLALLLERLDSGLRSGKQVEQALGLPALGLVPRLDRLKRGQHPHQYLIAKPLSAYAEAIRAIYTSMQLSDVDNPPKVILVTSALPQEGKTTLSVSLSTFAARSSQKVLLMDLDLRHPSVHRDLAVPAPEQGFVEYMAGEKTLDEVVQQDEETGLYYLPVKRQTANPTDLLGSQKMRQLVTTLRGAFDYIVIDSAPLLGVTDSKVAALLCDKVLFVSQWEKTTKETAQNGLAHLREINASVAGAVLTQVDVQKHAQYGYGDVGQYYGKYQKYYVN